MEDGVIFEIIDHVGRWLGRYPESLMKIGHDLVEKKFVPGSGSGWGWVFSMFKDRFKPINLKAVANRKICSKERTMQFFFNK